MIRSALLIGSLLCACVEGFTGSNVQIDFSPGTPVQASFGQTPMAGQLAANVHYTLYAIQETDAGSSLFALEQFEIHRIVDLASPCFIDVGEHVPHPGLHVSQFASVIAADNGFSVVGGVVDLANPPADATEQQKIDVATAVQREANVLALGSDMGIKVVSSASVATYPNFAPDCNGPDILIPPPTCTDEASNQRRLALCQEAWAADKNLFEGTDLVLTSPLNGVTHGMVDGINPINLAPVGGAQLFVDEALDTADAYAIYWQYDDANGDGVPDFPNPPPANQSATGELLFYGRPAMPTRGVDKVHMTSPDTPQLTADMAIFVDLGDDNVHF